MINTSRAKLHVGSFSLTFLNFSAHGSHPAFQRKVFPLTYVLQLTDITIIRASSAAIMKVQWILPLLSLAASAQAKIVDRQLLTYAPLPEGTYEPPTKPSELTLLDFIHSREELSSLSDVVSGSAGGCSHNVVAKDIFWDWLTLDHGYFQASRRHLLQALGGSIHSLHHPILRSITPANILKPLPRQPRVSGGWVRCYSTTTSPIPGCTGRISQRARHARRQDPTSTLVRSWWTTNW